MSERPHDVEREHVSDGRSIHHPSTRVDAVAARGPGIDLGAAIVQAKLTVGPAHDPLETEADAVADRVVRSLSGPQTAQPPATSRRVRRSATGQHRAGSAVQRSEEGRADEIGPEGGDLDNSTQRMLQSSRGGGRSLPDGAKSTMETAFGTDFSGVRVHTGSQARQLSERIQATAFTTGNDIYFRDGLPDTSSTPGQHLLAHELAHTVQQGGKIQRLWGFGNTGRTKGEERDIIGRSGHGPDEIATEVAGLLKKKRFTSQITRFNKVMQLLTTPKVKAVESAYNTQNAGQPPFKEAIKASFTKKSFRWKYLHHVIDKGGTPDQEHRILLALGLAGNAAQSMISDQEEAMRLFQGLSTQQQRDIHTRYSLELKSGMSSKGYAQLRAIVEAAAAQDTFATEQAALASQPSGGGGGGGQSDIDPYQAQFDAAVRILQQQDRELGVIVARGLKAESTTVFDAVTVRMAADVKQMADEVKDWVERAKKIEAASFAGEPHIREYVTHRLIALDFGNGRTKTVQSPEQTQFEKHLAERAYKYGWNPGDREYIRQLVRGGTATMPQDATGAVDVDATPEGDASAHLALVTAAIPRAQSPDVVAALAAVAGELKIVDQLTAKNRRQRLREEVLAVKPAQAWELMGALLNRPIPIDGDDDTTITAKQAELSKGVKLAARIFETAELKPKHISQFVAKLRHGEKATPGYLELRRYAWKGTFETGKFLRRISALSPEEREMASNDDRLEAKVTARLAPFPSDLAQISAYLGWPKNPPTPAGQQPAPAAVQQPAAPLTPQQQAEETKAKQAWADRWTLLLNGSKDHKKIYNFAIQIMAAAPATSSGSDYVKEVAALISDPASKAKLESMKLGKAIKKNEEIGGSGFDLVESVIGKSKTARPTGNANVDAICGTFESMTGKQLLTEWTNFDELIRAQGALATRKAKLDALNALWATIDLDDQAQVDELNTELDALRASNARLVSGFLLTMKDSRRDQLNSGISQLTTAEYQTVRDRHAAHLASQIDHHEGFRSALLEHGVMPSELKSIGANIVFVADQAKQSNLDTWNQWSWFTVRGQLRNESAGLLTGKLNTLHSATAKGGDTSADAEAFAEQREELKSRTKVFVETANEYKSRLKTVINMILSVIVTICTAGIGSVGALALAAINAAIEITKQIMMNALDQLLAPGQSSFSGEMIIGTIKTLLMSGLSLGVGALTNQLKESFNLVDANGLARGDYLLNGSHVNSNALQVGTKLTDSSWQGWGTNLGMKMITGGVQKAGTKVVGLATDSLAHGPNGALKNLKASFKWSEVLDLTVGVAFKDFIARAQGDMLAGVKTDGVKDQRDVLDDDGNVVVEDAQVLKKNSAWGHVGALDSAYSKNMTTSDSVSSKLVKQTAKVATDQTAIKVMNLAYSAPVGELDAIVANQRDIGQGTPAKSDGPKAIKLKSATKRVIDAHTAISGASPSLDQLREFEAAILELMADPYHLEALVALRVESGESETDAKKAATRWCLDSLAWVREQLKPPPVPPKSPAMLASTSTGGSSSQGSSGP